MVLRGGVERTAGDGAEETVGGVGWTRIELMAACKASVINCWLSCMGGDILFG